MSTNISKQKREDLLNKIKEIPVAIKVFFIAVNEILKLYYAAFLDDNVAFYNQFILRH